MTTKVLKLELKKIPATDAAGNSIDDPIGSRINTAYADASMSGFGLAAAYETTLVSEADPAPAGPTHLMLFFQKP